MKIVFIAGAYSAPTEWGVIQNIRASEDAAIQVWNIGAAAMCSNKNQAFLGGAAPSNVWLEGNLEFVRRSDAVFCVSGWEKSSGARAEVEAAQKANIPHFSDMGQLRAWLEKA